MRPLAEHEAYINIENVVASATLNQRIDLNSIVRIFPGVEYRPEQFPGLVYRLKKPKTATLILKTIRMPVQWTGPHSPIEHETGGS